jgi:hypothetical protein
VDIGGEAIPVAHSQLDIGQTRDMFDGDTFTLARGVDVNPFIVEFNFPSPRALKGLNAVLGRMDFTIKAQLFTEGSSQPKEYTAVYRDLPGEPAITLDFPNAPTDVTRMRVEFAQLNPPEEGHSHVRELKLTTDH